MARVWRVLAAALAVLLVVSASVGVKVYLDHVAAARELSGVRDYSELLSRISELSYNMTFDGVTLKVHAVCETDCRRGVIRVYDGRGALLYTVEFEYRDRLFIANLTLPDGSRTPLDPIAYLDGIAGGVVFRRDANGTVVGVEAFPGLAPLLLPYHIGLKRGIDWSKVAKLEGDPAARLAAPALAQARVAEREYRGLHILLEGYGVYWANHEWLAPRVEMILASIDGTPVATTAIITLPKPNTQDHLTITINLEAIKKAK